nr:MAG TPA: hypothetical protein [Caudoviricetes sp.]
MNVIRTISAPERRSLKRLSTKAATPAVRAQVLAVTDEEVPEDTLTGSPAISSRQSDSIKRMRASTKTRRRS